MGKVIVKNVLLKNHEDEILAGRGYIKQEEVRSVTLDMIANTGTIEVGLPESIIEKLGLPFKKEVKTRLADGTTKKRQMYKDLTVCIGDRETQVPCIGKPEGAPMLLGQTVFEHMSLVVDCPKQRVMPHPEETDGLMLFEDY